MAKRKYSSIGSGSYEGAEQRKSLESADFGMFGESKSSFANMPQSFVLKEFPKGGSYSDYGLDDTITNINRQMNDDSSGMKRHGRGPKKGQQ
jgi:hypothetical protein